jgi:hypothetical protein
VTQLTIDNNQVDINEVLEKLKDYFNEESSVNVIGTFEWDEIVRPSGRIKKSYKIIDSTIVTEPDNKSHLAWYINTRSQHLELIVDFKFQRMGEVSLYQFNLTETGLQKIKSKLLKIR